MKLVCSSASVPISVWVKDRVSSLVLPISTGACVKVPDAMRLSVSTGRVSVPLVGWKYEGWTDSSFLTGTARMHEPIVDASVQPTLAATAVAWLSATVSVSVTHCPLWMIARENRPFEPGAARCEHTSIAPDDWPPRVTFVGSPPKLAMLRRTQRSAAC